MFYLITKFLVDYPLLLLIFCVLLRLAFFNLVSTEVPLDDGFFFNYGEHRRFKVVSPVEAESLSSGGSSIPTVL